MHYLLDTNVVSDLVRNPNGPVTRRIREVGEKNVCTSIIVAAEMRYEPQKGIATPHKTTRNGAGLVAATIGHRSRGLNSHRQTA
jgi:predicted nucleic acid-binding protein